MVRAYYMDSVDSDPREEHQRDPPKCITLAELCTSTGVEYYSVNPDQYLEDSVLRELREKRGYNFEDEIICSKECLANYEDKLRNFYTEHLHTDEEIRLVLEGCGYFDVRDPNDEWIRIEVTAGDLLIIPCGIYHRFTLDKTNYIRAKRYFVGEPVWTPHNRPADSMECRKDYLENLTSGRWKAEL